MTTRDLECQEIKRVFECVDGCNAARNRAMLITGIGLALRASELCGLLLSDVVDDNGDIKQYVTIRSEIAKFGKERTVRVWGIVKQELEAYLTDTDIECGALFGSREGGHLTRQAFYSIVKKIFKKAGIDQSPHALRKTGATLFYRSSNADLIATQHFLGHASPETTRRYVGISSTDVKKYTQKSSDMFLNAIKTGEFYAIDNMSNSSLTLQKAIEFIQSQGFDVNLSQRKTKEGKIIKFRKIA